MTEQTQQQPQTSGYVPQAGTVPAKVLAYLRTLPEGAEVATVPLLEAIRCSPADSKSMCGYMATAVAHGAVRKRRQFEDRRSLVWSLGDGRPVPVARDADDEPAANEPAAPAAPFALDAVWSPEPPPPPSKPAKAPRQKPARAAAAAASSGVATAKAPAVARPVLHAVAAAAPSPAPGLRMALWTTGELMVELQGEEFMFTAQQTADLARYLAASANTPLAIG